VNGVRMTVVEGRQSARIIELDLSQLQKLATCSKLGCLSLLRKVTSQS
jgi:hypothetical protein